MIIEFLLAQLLHVVPAQVASTTPTAAEPTVLNAIADWSRALDAAGWDRDAPGPRATADAMVPVLLPLAEQGDDEPARLARAALIEMSPDALEGMVRRDPTRAPWLTWAYVSGHGSLDLLEAAAGHPARSGVSRTIYDQEFSLDHASLAELLTALRALPIDHRLQDVCSIAAVRPAPDRAAIVSVLVPRLAREDEHAPVPCWFLAISTPRGRAAAVRWVTQSQPGTADTLRRRLPVALALASGRDRPTHEAALALALAPLLAHAQSDIGLSVGLPLLSENAAFLPALSVEADQLLLRAWRDGSEVIGWMLLANSSAELSRVIAARIGTSAPSPPAPTPAGTGQAMDAALEGIRRRLAGLELDRQRDIEAPAMSGTSWVPMATMLAGTHGIEDQALRRATEEISRGPVPSERSLAGAVADALDRTAACHDETSCLVSLMVRSPDLVAARAAYLLGRPRIIALGEDDGHAVVRRIVLHSSPFLGATILPFVAECPPVWRGLRELRPLPESTQPFILSHLRRLTLRCARHP